MIRFSSAVRHTCRVVLVFAASGCGDLARVNPYDPSAPFDITLTGPARVQVGDTITIAAEVTPAWTRPEQPQWSSSDIRVLNPLGNGRYVAVAGGEVTIEVRFGPRVQSLELSVESLAPTISAVTPQRARADTGQVSLIITGTGFHPLTVVTWDGAARKTQYVDATRLLVELSAGDIGVVGLHALVAINGAPGGGSSPPATFESTAPTPRIRSMTRSYAMAGSGAFSLDLSGTYMTRETVVRWNGADRPTTFLSSSAVRTTIAAEDVAVAGTAAITVASAGESSAPMPFPVLASPVSFTSRITVSLASRAILYDSARSRLYASVPVGSPDFGGHVAIIDPLSGAVIASIPTGGDPGVMALSDDHRYLHVALVVGGAVARIDLVTGAKDLVFSLGGTEVCGPYHAYDMVALPEEPRTVVIARAPAACGNSSTAVFDNGTMRPRVTSVSGPHGDRITGSGRPDRVYAHNQDEAQMVQLTVDATGIARAPMGTNLIPTGAPTDIEYDMGYVFSSRGMVVDPFRLERLVTIATSGAVRPDVNRGRVHFFQGSILRTFHPFVGGEIGGLSIAEADGATGIVRWGTDGIALRRADRIVLIRSPLVGP